MTMGIEQMLVEARETETLAGAAVAMADALAAKALSRIKDGHDSAIADVVFCKEACTASRAAHDIARRVLALATEIAREVN